jgi:hypothetical protein
MKKWELSQKKQTLPAADVHPFAHRPWQLAPAAEAEQGAEGRGGEGRKRSSREEKEQ